MSDKQGLSAVDIILIFIAFLIVVLVFFLIRKIYYAIRYKKRFFIIPRVGIKGITSIAMVISISITVIILLTIASANILGVIFRAWPGTRVTIEGILIKIGGLLFGPIIGMFIGGLTDLLTVALTAGVFHYGYLIASMAYGLIGGIIKMALSSTKKREYMFAILVTLISAVIAALVGWYLDVATSSIYSFEMFGVAIKIPKQLMIGLLVSFILSSIIVVWMSYLIRTIMIKKNKMKKNQPNVLAPTIVAIILCEAVVNVLMMPSFDAELSSLTYLQWLTIRSLLFLIMIFINFAIIYPIFKIVVPLINYDYTKELVEPKSVPIYVE